MTTQIGPLQFAPYQGGKSGTLVAVVNLDSTVDTLFTVPITGIYNTSSVSPNVVVVFNTQNNGTVMCFLGPVEIDVPPFTRDSISLSGSTGTQIGVNLTIGRIQLQFYQGTPPVSPQLYNYAGAASVANSSILQYIIAPIVTIGAVTGTFSTETGPPLITGGASILTLPFTWKSGASTAEINIQVKGTVGVNDGYMCALFDAVTNKYIDEVNTPMLSGLGQNYYFTLNTFISSPGAGVGQTFNLRLGSNSGNAFILNSFDSGGPPASVGWTSFFVVKELLPQQ